MYYNKYILIHSMNNYIILEILQTPPLNTRFTQRLYSVHAVRPQRAHGALLDPTASTQRAV